LLCSYCAFKTELNQLFKSCFSFSCKKRLLLQTCCVHIVL
jgi:hypothetical protein